MQDGAPREDLSRGGPANGGVRHCLMTVGFSVLLLLSVVPPIAHSASFSELILRGFEQLKGQRHEEAAATFAAALELQPESTPARKGLATACAALGVLRLQAGRLREGRELLERAVEAQPDSAGYRVLLARAIFNSADTRAARAEIDRALELAPADAGARELSGDIYDREGLLNLAVGEWEKAAVSGGSHGIAAKIARGRREMAAEEGMGRESSRYFLVLYESGVSSDVVEAFFKELDLAFDVLHDKLGEYPRDQITVLLYAKADFTSVTGAPEWSAGQYDGKIRIPVGSLASPEESFKLRSTLVHEMTHAFLFRMAPVGLPRWFHEGLAKAIEGWDPGRIRAFFAEHPPEGLETLDDVERTLVGRGGDVTAGYAAARLAVADLEELRGMGGIRRIIAGVGAGEAFAEVFREEMRLEIPEFEDRWRRSFR